MNAQLKKKSFAILLSFAIIIVNTMGTVGMASGNHGASDHAAAQGMQHTAKTDMHAGHASGNRHSHDVTNYQGQS